MTDQPRLLVLGAHPDDAEFHGGGIAARYRSHGHTVKFVSVTNGAAGHHRYSPTELARVRKEEARRSGTVLGIEYEVWDFPDGSLQPTLAVREQIIREIRQFRPDLVLTHRTSDYHPDHRAVGQAVQDASYLVTVPLVVPEVPFLRKDPIVAYLPDLFTKPTPLEPHIVIDISEYLDCIVAMLSCHESQVFDFLPFNMDMGEVPEADEERRDWLRVRYSKWIAPRADRFRDALLAEYGDAGQRIELCEAFEISEYAGSLDDEARNRLFGGGPNG